MSPTRRLAARRLAARPIRCRRPMRLVSPMRSLLHRLRRLHRLGLAASVGVVAAIGVAGFAPTAAAAGAPGTSLASVTTPASAVVSADDDLHPRLVAACARIPVAETRIGFAIERLDGAADRRGSLAWFAATIERAESNGRTRVAADLQRRLDRLTERRAVLDERLVQLDDLRQTCLERGISA